MSYSSFGATHRPGPCIRLYANYLGTNIGGWICPVEPGQTTHQPPRPRPCEGGLNQVQEALRLLGRYRGEVDGLPNAETERAIRSIADDHGISWNGDLWCIGADICNAIIQESLQKIPCPRDGSDLVPGCIQTGGGPMNKYIDLVYPPQPSSPPATSSESTYAPTRKVLTLDSAKRLQESIRTPSKSSKLPTLVRRDLVQDGSQYMASGPQIQEEDSEIPWKLIGGAAIVGGIGAIVLLQQKKRNK